MRNRSEGFNCGKDGFSQFLAICGAEIYSDHPCAPEVIAEIYSDHPRAPEVIAKIYSAHPRAPKAIAKIYSAHPRAPKATAKICSDHPRAPEVIAKICSDHPRAPEAIAKIYSAFRDDPIGLGGAYDPLWPARLPFDEGRARRPRRAVVRIRGKSAADRRATVVPDPAAHRDGSPPAWLSTASRIRPE